MERKCYWIYDSVKLTLENQSYSLVISCLDMWRMDRLQTLSSQTSLALSQSHWWPFTLPRFYLFPNYFLWDSYVSFHIAVLICCNFRSWRDWYICMNKVSFIEILRVQTFWQPRRYAFFHFNLKRNPLFDKILSCILFHFFIILCVKWPLLLSLLGAALYSRSISMGALYFCLLGMLDLSF